ICFFLTPGDAVRAQRSSKAGSLAQAAASQRLWAAHASRVFGLCGETSCCGPCGEHGEHPGQAEDWQSAFSLWE
ncbi:unnamed protein product, partial [Polarella glacialis]